MGILLKIALILTILIGSHLYGQGFLTLEEKKNYIQNIKATLLPDGKSVYIQWESQLKEGEIIIARSNSMIDTPEKLYISDSLGRFPARVEKSITNFYDYNLKPGTYYYAIVSVQDVRNRKVKLYPGENFTTEPVIIEKSSPQESTKKLIPEKQTEGTRNVAAILAKTEGNNIRISWVPPWNAIPGKTIYSIYRSNSPMSTEFQMREATKLAELPHPITNYLDQDIKESQTLFYGVSVKDDTMEEQLPLQEGKSFVRVFFVRDRFGKAEAIRDSQPAEITKEDEKVGDIPSNFIVRNLRYVREGRGAILEWDPPPNADVTTQYTVYAGLKPFIGEVSFLGNSVLKVATLNHPRNALHIKEIKKIDNLHFAVTAKKADIPEVFKMVQGSNTIPFQFSEEGPASIAKEETSPEYDKEDSSPKKVKEEENKVLPISPVQSWTNEESTPDKTPLDSQKSPYISTIESLPESKPEPPKDGSISENEDIDDYTIQDPLEEILKRTYGQKNYDAAIYELTEYLKKANNPEKIGKANLFLGMAHYQKGNYQKALDLFLKKETERYNKNRTEFWKNLTLAKIGKTK